MSFLRCLPLLLSLAHAETTLCTQVTSLPATLSGSAVYCLKGNLTISLNSGAAITISGAGATLDLNGWTLSDTYSNPSAGSGILVTGANVVVKNGFIKNFYQGVTLNGSSGVAQDLRVSIGYIGVRVNSVGFVVQHNVLDSPFGGGQAIWIDAGEGTVLENVASSVGTGIRVVNADSYTLIDNNRLTGSYGLYFDTNGAGTIRNNLTHSAYGNHLSAYVIDAGGNN